MTGGRTDRTLRSLLHQRALLTCSITNIPNTRTHPGSRCTGKRPLIGPDRYPEALRLTRTPMSPLGRRRQGTHRRRCRDRSRTTMSHGDLYNRNSRTLIARGRDSPVLNRTWPDEELGEGSRIHLNAFSVLLSIFSPFVLFSTRTDFLQLCDLTRLLFLLSWGWWVIHGGAQSHPLCYSASLVHLYVTSDNTGC